MIQLNGVSRNAEADKGIEPAWPDCDRNPRLDPRGKPRVPIRIPQASSGLAGQRLERSGQIAEHIAEHAVDCTAQECHASDADDGDQAEEQAVLGQRGALFTPGEPRGGGV